MKILVLNCGSSSFKYQLIDMDNDEVIAKGNYERIGMDGSFLTHKFGNEKKVYEHAAPNHEEAITFTMQKFVEPGIAVVSSLDEIDGIGHRIVHGGERFTSSVVITEDVVEGIKDAIKFAPLRGEGRAVSGTAKRCPRRPLHLRIRLAVGVYLAPIPRCVPAVWYFTAHCPVSSVGTPERHDAGAAGLPEWPAAAVPGQTG